MKTRATFLCLLIGLLLSACSGGGGGGDPLTGAPFRYDPEIPGQVAGVQAASGDQVVTLNWTSQYAATSYNIYYTADPSASGWAHAIRMNVTTNSYPIWGLTNNVTYYFIVTAVNRDGEGLASVPVASAPGPITQADLTGTWYFHTLVSGPSAKWERGTVVFDGSGVATFTDFLDSAHFNPVNDTSTPVAGPADIVVTVQGNGSLAMSGADAWADFQATMGSRKNMWVGTWTFSVDGSRAITVFQKQRVNRDTGLPANDYNVWDIAGTSSGQNPSNPDLAGNGPTRFSYHALNSGSNIDWEYSSARVGQQGQFWVNPFPPVNDFIPLTSTGTLASVKDIIYWSYSTPTYKIAEQWDLLWKVTCFGMRWDGAVKEFNSYGPAALRDASHNVVFTGRMTDDKTVVVGVSTKNAIDSSQTSTGSIQTIPTQYYLRILQLNFVPTDQAMPTYTINDVAGTYKFHKIGAVAIPGGSQASWAYGKMRVTNSGVTTFPEYTDSDSLLSTPDTFTLAYYPDTGSDGHTWTTFANFVSPDTGTAATQYDPPFMWTWWNALTNMTQSGSGVRLIPPSPYYFNEHATLSYNRDLLVMTRTDGFGYSMVIGLK